MCSSDLSNEAGSSLASGGSNPTGCLVNCIADGVRLVDGLLNAVLRDWRLGRCLEMGRGFPMLGQFGFYIESVRVENRNGLF